MSNVVDNVLSNEGQVISEDIELTDDIFEKIGTSGLDAEEISGPRLTYWADVWRRFKGSKLSLLGLMVLGCIVFFVIFGPRITGYDYTYIDPSIKNQTSSFQHWFGTDRFGRDLFTRACIGGRVSIVIGLVCTAVMFAIGATLGAIAGFRGGLIDDLIMRFCELIVSIPYLVLVVVFTVIMGRSMFSLVFAMSITSWINTARMVRGQILKIKEQDFVSAAIALGADTKRIIIKHLLPNILGIIMVTITISVPRFIFGEAFLSFIGLGIQPPETSWGALAAEGQITLVFNPHQLFFSILVYSFNYTVISFNW